MSYLVVLIVASLLVSALLFFVTDQLHMRRSQAFMLVCGILPVILLTVGFFHLLPDAAPTPAETVDITEGRIADSGPRSFALGLQLGIVPAFVYFFVSAAMFFARQGLKSK